MGIEVGEGFSVSPPVLDATARRLQSTGNEIVGLRGDLQAKADLGTALGFPVAIGAYDSMFAVWAGDLEATGDLVVRLGGGTATASGNYTTTDNSVAGLFE